VVSSPASPLSLGTSSKHSPLTIEDVSAGFFNYSSFVSSKKLALNSSQLASLVKAGSRPGGPAATGHYAMVNQEIIYVTVAGNSSAPVTIDDISVVKHCGLPLGRGATLFYSPAGAGSISTSPVYFDLDNPITSGRLLSKQTGKVYGNFFTHHVVTLKYQEPWTFVIYVTASAHYCQYHFNISIATANGPRTETINDHGLPFSLTSDGESMTTASHVRFSSYAAIYVTVRDSQGNLHFVRVNPKTYHGQPNPSPY
jgi:hypothetical protein